ncbi:MAG TPA: M20/M25/M40 family metallo-hydrolase [Terriglobia bacterium]|nr:M20/M25/M40 family metallo-hydrolase [Terriglobia bacterium]
MVRWKSGALMAALITLVVATMAVSGAQVGVDPNIQAKIRAEGMDRSEIMRTMHVLTDIYGPRLTGSPNHENAARWAIRQMESWGLVNGRLEPWDFARPGWLNEEASGQIVAPVKDNLVFEVLAWTPSTRGTVIANVVQLILPTGPPAPNRGRGGGAQTPTQTFLGPTEDELKQYLAGMAPQVKGAIVLVGPHINVPFQEQPPAKRLTEQAARARYNPPASPAPAPARGGGGGQRGPAPQQGPARLTNAQVAAILNDFLVANGVVVRVNDAGREHGQIRAFNFSGYDPTKTVPTVVLRNEDYGRVSRILADGSTVTLKFTIVNRDFPEGKTSYNAIAEIEGTDKKEEVVMLGGHLDSWHSATGATDNAIGCAIMMEAARILKSIGVRPRRTIRVALWSGEEQGLLGSQAYVSQHFGAAEDPKPEFRLFNGYFNVDSGTGLIHGASIFGPSEAAAFVGQHLKQFEDFGVYGAISTSSRATSGTDSTSFNAAGLPGIGLGQDPIEYNSHTWHTNLDTLERIVEDDAKKSATAIAYAVYQLAMSDEMIPRFSREAMPSAPQAAQTTGR